MPKPDDWFIGLMLFAPAIDAALILSFVVGWFILQAILPAKNGAAK
jgi:hypothetical protein